MILHNHIRRPKWPLSAMDINSDLGYHQLLMSHDVSHDALTSDRRSGAGAVPPDNRSPSSTSLARALRSALRITFPFLGLRPLRSLRSLSPPLLSVPFSGPWVTSSPRRPHLLPPPSCQGRNAARAKPTPRLRDLQSSSQRLRIDSKAHTEVVGPSSDANTSPTPLRARSLRRATAIGAQKKEGPRRTPPDPHSVAASAGVALRIA